MKTQTTKHDYEMTDKEKYLALRSRVVNLMCLMGYGDMPFSIGLDKAIEDLSPKKRKRHAKT